MKLVIQRVKYASVTVEEKVIGKIDKGFLILLGVGKDDNEDMVNELVEKIIKLRIFEDENNKMNLSIKDINGEMLIVSQFTLYADCKKGNRPSFCDAAEPNKAEQLYEYFISKVKENNIKAEHGEFGADMKVELLNDGPVTIVLEK